MVERDSNQMHVFEHLQKIKKAYLEKKIVLCMVARLEIHKDQETLIKAVKILKDNDFENIDFS